jgi:hypothetical protein
MSSLPTNEGKRSAGSFRVFLALVALAGWYSSDAAAESLTEALEAYKKQVEPHLPVQVDDETRLDAVKVKGDTLSFRYTLLTVTKEEFSKKELLEMVRSVGIKDSCSAPNLRKYLDRGAKFHFAYHSKNNGLLASFEIDKTACNKGKAD